jgi:hypothetical protein
MATEYRPAPRAVVGGRNMDPGKNSFNLFLLQFSTVKADRKLNT